MTLSAALLPVLLALHGFTTPTAAPVPPPPPIPDKAPPTSWKIADLNALLPNPEDPGTVVVLVWEVIDHGVVLDRLERCLVVKKYGKPKEGEAYALGLMNRWLDEDGSGWKVELLYLTGVKPGELAEIVGTESYKTLPSDTEIADFLKSRSWSNRVNPYELTIRRGRGTPLRKEKVTPKVADGGICRADWKKVFDREPPAKLFPELTAPIEKK